MNDEFKKYLDELQREAHDVVLKKLQRRGKSLDKLFDDLLEANKEKIMCKLLGFDCRWHGDWELDHCNGRSGESIAGQYIKTTALAAAQSWLAKQVGKFPDLDSRAVASLRSEYKETLLNELRERVRKQARIDADKVVQEVISATVGDNFKLKADES